MTAYDSPITEKGPRSYAYRLATYITDASTIRAACLRQYSFGAPTREQIAVWIAEHQAKRQAERAKVDNSPVNLWPEKKYVEPVPVVVEAAPKPEPKADIGGYTAFPADLVRNVATGFGLTYADMVGKRQFAPIVHARATASMILHERGLSAVRIGHYLGKRDHSTILNQLEKFDIYKRKNPKVGWVYEANRTQREKVA